MFKDYSQNQMFLLPPSITELIPEDSPVWIVNEILNRVEINNIENSYSTLGAHAYHPRMLLKIIFYGYMNKIRSSRRLAKAVRRDIEFIYLAAWNKPDFRTISDFRKNHIDKIKEIFKEIVKIALEMEIASVFQIAIDSTRYKANASPYKAKRVREWEKELKESVEEYLKESIKVDEEEDRLYGEKEGDELPKEIASKKVRKEKIKMAIENLKKEEREKNISISITDKDARFMKKRGNSVLGYRGHISVDTKGMIILNYELTNEGEDTQHLIKVIEGTEEATNEKVREALADNGYNSGKNLKKLEEMGIAGYIPLGSERAFYIKNGKRENLKLKKEDFKYKQLRDEYICPMGERLKFKREYERKDGRIMRVYRANNCKGCILKRLCVSNRGNKNIDVDQWEEYRRRLRKRMESEEGKRKYKKRKETVEPVIGTIKQAMGVREFLLRGKRKVEGEFGIVAIGYNLKKIWGHLKEKLKTEKMKGLNLAIRRGYRIKEEILVYA